LIIDHPWITDIPHVRKKTLMYKKDFKVIVNLFSTFTFL